MSGKTVNSAILLLVIGNALALISDAIIKLQGADVPVFQFVFIRTLCTLVLLLPLSAMIDRGNLFAGGRVHLLRAHISLAGISCMVVALNTLPLATANALFYAAPILVMVIAVLVFRENLTPLSLLAVVSGFAGIILILRPVALNWASLSAIGVAFSLAINIVLIRKLPGRQSMVHTLVLTHLYMLPAAFLLTLWEGKAFEWSVVIHAFGSAFFILCYNVTVLMAYRWVAANQVTSAEYTGLLWAIIGGWVFFGEVPDMWFIIGSTMIVAPLILIGLAERKRKRVLRQEPASVAVAE
ncbi:DMT family transporter [Saccharospirillum salsuginis]|uniref:Membrane protein n=1 Tax=Saccharospirillum salsuginis TaxID=418750 RepID=A0A918KHD4_9GAMM|nr:DMT family transporter [Saccharospirillum salsuginis]GGX62963.1 membrane protein [Saccharospirillum salsuginis]